MEIRILVELAVVASNSTKSCFVAMSLSFTADIESARGFVALIPLLCALLDGLRTMHFESFVDLGRLSGPSTTAAVLATALVSPAATVTAGLMGFWLRIVLALLARAMAQDVRPRIGKQKFEMISAVMLEVDVERMEVGKMPSF